MIASDCVISNEYTVNTFNNGLLQSLMIQFAFQNRQSHDVALAQYEVRQPK